METPINQSSVFFEEFTLTPGDFFGILPADWRESIEPYWPEYTGAANIYVLKTTGSEIFGGGIVFHKVSPDTRGYAIEAQKLFDNGYLYIGFLWINENRRNKKFGSYWLRELFKKNPNQKYWLGLEDIELANFYRLHGFELTGEVLNEGVPEWLMVRE